MPCVLNLFPLAHNTTVQTLLKSHPYIRGWEIPWNSWEKAGQKLGIFPRNLLGFLGFHANEEAGKMSNFSQESLDKSQLSQKLGKRL